MACDIHMYTEKLIMGRWASVDPKESNRLYGSREEEPKYRLKRSYYWRNYELFAMLAGVRNEYDIRPVSYPRGLPPGVSDEVRAEARRLAADAHSHSYHTLRQLSEYDWHGQTFIRQVIVNFQGYLEFKEMGRPDSWCEGVVGPPSDFKNVSNLEMEALLAAGEPLAKIYLTPVGWQETYAEAASDFLEIVMPKLGELAEGDSDSVRLVFWFDN